MKNQERDFTHPQWAFEEAQRISKIGSYEIDIKTNQKTWSRQAAMNFGLDEMADMNSVNMESLMHADDIAAVRQHWKSCIANRKDFDFEYRVIRPNGEKAVMHGLGHLLVDSENRPTKMIGTIRDVTEYRTKEQKIKEQETKLFHASRLCSLGQVATGIAHEINNPLTVILTKAYLMEKQLSKLSNSTSTERLSNDCSVITRMSRRIDQIIKSLRAMSGDGDQTNYYPSKVGDIVQDALALWRQKLVNSGTSLKLNLQAENDEFDCKSVQVSQILVNLISNAYDAIESSEERWICINTKTENDSIEFRVSDSGSGVLSSIRDRIMEPFFTTKDVGKGTGLGLSISNAIASEHGGSLYLDLTQENTTFVAQFPLKQRAQPTQQLI